MLYACPICDDRSDKNSYLVKEMYYGTRRQFEYGQCRDCGVLCLKDAPTDIREFYPDDYHCHEASKPGQSVLRQMSEARNKAALVGNPFVGKIMDLFKPAPTIFKVLGKAGLSLRSKILDIGCGSGDLLRDLRNMGFEDLSGMDAFIPDALEVREKGLIIEKKPIEEIKGPFNFVMLNHSLEHMADHKKMFSEIRRLISPDGVCLIRTPIVGGIAWKTYQAHWYQLDAPRHFVIHSEGSLGRLASSAGFRIFETVYDSEETQFVRSELYQKNISMKDFFKEYQGEVSKVFSTQQLTRWKKMAKDANRSRSGDQAAFFLRMG